MDAEMYNIFYASTPKVQIKVHRLDSVGKATSGRQRAKSSFEPKRTLCDVTNKIPNDHLECHLSPMPGCEKIRNETKSPFGYLTRSSISQSGRKRVVNNLRSPLKEVATNWSPVTRRTKSITEFAAPVIGQKNCKSEQTGSKKVLRYSGSPCAKFTVYNDDPCPGQSSLTIRTKSITAFATPVIGQKNCKSEQTGCKKVIRYSGSPCTNFTIYNDYTDERSGCTSVETSVCSEYENDVFLNKSDCKKVICSGSPCTNFTIYNDNTNERSGCTSIETTVCSEYENDVFLNKSDCKKVIRYLGSPCNNFTIYNDNTDERSGCTSIETSVCSKYENDVFLNKSDCKKVIRYLGSPCTNFTIYNDNTDERSGCPSIETSVCSEYEDDVFLNKMDSLRTATIVQIYDSFENDDEEGPWFPRKFFNNAEEMHTLIRGDMQPNLQNHSLVLPRSPVLSKHLSVGLSPLNISYGLLPSPKTVEITNFKLE